MAQGCPPSSHSSLQLVDDLFYLLKHFGIFFWLCSSSGTPPPLQNATQTFHDLRSYTPMTDQQCQSGPSIPSQLHLFVCYCVWVSACHSTQVELRRHSWRSVLSSTVWVLGIKLSHQTLEQALLPTATPPQPRVTHSYFSPLSAIQ